MCAPSRRVGASLYGESWILPCPVSFECEWRIIIATNAYAVKLGQYRVNVILDIPSFLTTLSKYNFLWRNTQFYAIKPKQNQPRLSGNWLLETLKSLFISIVFNLNALMKCVMSNRFKVTHNESINETLLCKDLYHWTMHDPVSWWIQSKEFVDDHNALGNIYILMKWVKPLSFSDLRPVVKTLKSNKHVNANQL